MLDVTSLGTVSVAFFVAAASPGPATIAAATVSMSHGRAAGLRFGAGLSIGLAFWGIVAATGLGAVLQTSSHALSILKVFGGGYLLWLAYGSARSASRAESTPLALRSIGFRKGLILNLSNPKAVLAWMATLALGLGNASGVAQVALATSVCILLGFAIYVGYALVFSTPGAMDVYRRARRWIDGAVAGLFAVAGLGLIRSAFSRA